MHRQNKSLAVHLNNRIARARRAEGRAAARDSARSSYNSRRAPAVSADSKAFKQRWQAKRAEANKFQTQIARKPPHT